MSDIEPKNLSARRVARESIKAADVDTQLSHRGVGNPPSAHPSSAISNTYPGLETDFRNVWRFVLEGIQLHESRNLVVAVDDDAPEDVRQVENFFLLTVDGDPMQVPMRGPAVVGARPVELKHYLEDRSFTQLEWANSLARVLRKAGTEVECVFLSRDGTKTVTLRLKVRRVFETAPDATDVPVIRREMAPPGALTQSLCSPWQNDYRECACFYWAASRPDFVNVEPTADGTSAGHNWLQRDRDAKTPKTYVVDDRHDPRLVTYAEVMRDWEAKLRFVVGGEDEETR